MGADRGGKAVFRFDTFGDEAFSGAGHYSCTGRSKARGWAASGRGKPQNGACFRLGLTTPQQADLVQYLKSL
jgi:hypothetical protein